MKLLALSQLSVNGTYKLYVLPRNPVMRKCDTYEQCSLIELASYLGSSVACSDCSHLEVGCHKAMSVLMITVGNGQLPIIIGSLMFCPRGGGGGGGGGDIMSSQPQTFPLW